MDTLNFNQVLTVYAWFPLAVLLSIMVLIARFYQNLSGEKTYYYLFAVPIILFGVAFAYYASIDQVFGDPLGDFLLFLGGVILLAMSLMLYRQMTTGR